MAIPGRPSPAPPIAPPGSPVVPAKPAGIGARPPLGDAPTAQRNVIPEPVAPARPAPVAPVVPAAAAGEIDVDVSEEPSPEPPAAPAPASKPNQPAPTVMFEPGGAHSNIGMSNFDKPLASAEPASPADVPEEVELPEESSGAKPISTRTKQKGKQGPRKLYKPKSGLASKRDDEEDEDLQKSSSSKLGLIIFLSLVAVGVLVVGIVLLRGKGKSEDSKAKEAPAAQEKATPSAEPSPFDKPAALAPTPAAVPPAPKLAKPEPARAEKPSPPARPAAPRPVAERPTASEKPRPEPASAGTEPKAEGGKANEENRQRANEAYKRGNTNLFAGKTTEAIAEFSLAVKLNPKDPANHRGLGLAYAQAGKNNDAVKHLKLYLRGAPKANDRAMIEKRLNQLRGR
jgi:hypothetical protein